MAISKITLNGVVQMDVTGKTVTAGSMTSGTTALKNDGTDITGTIPLSAVTVLAPDVRDGVYFVNSSGNLIIGTMCVIGTSKIGTATAG